MWREGTKLDMLRKITSSILKEVSEDATKVRHIYGKSKKVSGQGYKYTGMGIGRNGEVVSRYVVMDNWKPLALSRVRHYCSAATKGIKSTSSSEEDGQEEKYDALRERQVRVETEAWNNAAMEYEELLVIMCEKKLAPNIPYAKSLFLDWFEPLKNAISAQCKDRKSCWGYSSCLNELPADMMAVIAMHKLMALLMMGGDHSSVTVFQASSEIGQAIEHQAKFLRFLEKSKGKASADVEDAPTNEQVKLGVKVTHLMKQQEVHQIRQRHDASKPWGPDKQLKVGSRLLQLLLETAYVQPPVDHSPDADAPPDVRPAFIHIKKSLSNAKKGAKRFGVIKCDPLVRQVLEKSAGTHLVIPYMPMVVPPLDWIGYDKGAYLFLPSYIMRTVGSSQRVALKRLSKGQLETVFEALNALGNTKWRINKAVLSIIDRIWASGGSLAGLVDRKDIPLPKEPDTDDASEINKWKWKVKNVKKKNTERHSQRCDVELKLAVARKLKDEEGFYYPHNLDFRGRAYPMHPHLNHLGSDLCRGILEFAEGRPLRASGLRWLKIHLANLYAGGVDKLSFEDRIAFIENHLEDVFDSADRPLEGGRWWLNADYPFQCLGACMNLTEALRSSSPEDYVSYMTVHQDGSCNGLQHYAALGRDKLGAKAVNLVAGDKPADVYSDIAKRVLEIMRMDAEKDPSIEPNAPLAKLLLYQVDRKLVKQTVMTSVYGVTYSGARDQIKRRLKERDVIADDRELFAAACYAAKVTMFTLGEIFEAARSIMSWLGRCAKKIASENQPVQWTTPVGLPVVQPYRNFGKRCIRTSLQVLTLRCETDKIMVGKQRTAFPPNFVHSLDASHMMMTAIACKRRGLSFAGVHDSYWTHACDVDEMNKILREKFVELYNQPILEMLLESFETSFPKLEFPPLPEHGDFDLREVLESHYFFN